MSRLDDLLEKALKMRGSERMAAFLALGVADAVMGTMGEAKDHRETLLDRIGNSVSPLPPDDYRAYDFGYTAVTGAETLGFAGAMFYGMKLPMVVVGADIGVRILNAVIDQITYIKEQKKEKKPKGLGMMEPKMKYVPPMSGIIGTARTLISKFQESKEDAREFE